MHMSRMSRNLNSSAMFNKTIAIILVSCSIPALTSAQQVKVPEDGMLSFTELALKYGGAVEEYDVTTSDGYILKLFRIPGDKTRPLLLVHGLLSSSNDFIIRGNYSLAATLKKAGYDTWFLNYRGNRHSRRHVTLDPDTDVSFWEFGPHQHAYYDLATCIDFILNKTGESKLSLIGHSEGTLITYILGAARPEYNDKIKVAIALAPVCHLQNVRKEIPLIVEGGYILRSLLKGLHMEEVAGFDSLEGGISRVFCGRFPLGVELCRQSMFFVAGFEIESEFMPILFSNTPSGTSRMNLEHAYQMVVTGRFANYDYGPERNMKVYRSTVAPDYDIKKVTMRSYLIAARTDILSVLQDQRRQARELPNVGEYILLKNELFRHNDFLWSREARHIVHPKVLKILKKYN